MGAPTKCPECGKQFNRPQSCGRHRLAMHGVKGKSYSASKYKPRTAVAATPTPATPAHDMLSFCPSCGLNLSVLRKVTSTLMRRQGT